jgi:hypothetical protein
MCRIFGIFRIIQFDNNPLPIYPVHPFRDVPQGDACISLLNNNPAGGTTG